MSGIIGVGSKSGIIGSTEIPGGYEEGTWTPTYGGSDGNPTVGYSINAGHYTKIGRYVICSAQMNTSSVSSGSGNVLLQPLPFAVGSETRMAGGSTVNRTQNWNSAANSPVGWYAQTTNTYAYALKYATDHDTSSNVAVSDLRTSSDSNQLIVTLVYQT